MPQQNNISDMMTMIKQSRNPQQLVMNMLMQNPQGKSILQTIQNGGNAKELFYQMAQQKGINPNQFISMFK